jgi:cellulose synthase/poly-beta-1,6-N-acetylglucosamine synthase-like glycosyltransferase
MTLTRVSGDTDVASPARRQWGSEKPRPPLPAVERPASHAATWMGGFAIIATIGLWLEYLRRTVLNDLLVSGFSDSTYLAQTTAYVLVMTLLTFSALMYLMARQGAMYRSRSHHRVPKAEIDAHFGAVQSSLTVLVPSYREDPDVVRATLMSAALQEYPDLRIVLLIDDPTVPDSDEAARSLAACRELPHQLMDLLHEPRERFAASLLRHEVSAVRGGPASSADLRSLALDFVWAADWLDFESASYPRTTSMEDFVAQEVLGALGNDCRENAAALFAALDQRAGVPAERMVQLARRLAWTFDAKITSFERKTFAHLPHDANKAMNLNAYMGLLGGSYRVVETRLGLVLRETTDDPDLVVPATDYVLTLDADSVLLREYCLRLVYHLELPGNERIAVIQTPYSAFRGATTRLERIAGATTDTQFIVHQGLTYYGATFWVGANAVIRWTALKDIEEVTYVDGYPVRRYVQDRTVIEDTESSIDLVAKGWSLYNYPERLSYSATPPDYGSLVVQRARWANGGLLILPKLWRFMRQERKAGRHVKMSQFFMRFNYMASIAWASIGLIFLLVFPFNSRLLSPVILLAALPYFIAMAYDFHRMGYKRTDVFRVYAFNLILLPVNLAGTFKSLQQAAAKSKIPFARTPKVRNRTAAPALFVLGAFLIAGYSYYTLQNDLRAGNWSNAAFAGFNGLLTTYAIVAFIGVRNSVVDVGLGMATWVRVPARPEDSDVTDPAAEPVPLDWEAVLYFGPGATDAGRVARGQGAAVTSRPPREGERRSRVRTDVDA